MLFINNEIQKQVISMTDSIDVQEAAFKDLALGLAAHRPRIDTYVPCERDDGYFRWGSMEGGYDGIFSIRMKSDICTWPRVSDTVWTEEWYCVEPGTFCGLVFLFSSQNGEPLAILNDGHIQHIRVGGGAGISARHLARADSRVVGMLGSGGMARSYLEGFCAVRDIRTAKVYSPTPANREGYAAEMSAALGIEVTPVDNAREAVRGVDIIACCTDTMVPVFEPEWLEPGMHVVNVGPAEIATEAFPKFDVIIRQGEAGVPPIRETDSQRTDIGNSPMAFIAGSAEERKRLPRKNPFPSVWHDASIPFFADLAMGRVEGRTRDDQITFYHNIGNQGLQFAAVGSVIYRNAKARGLGHEVPTELFLQDIRN